MNELASSIHFSISSTAIVKHHDPIVWKRIGLSERDTHRFVVAQDLYIIVNAEHFVYNTTLSQLFAPILPLLQHPILRNRIRRKRYYHEQR